MSRETFGMQAATLYHNLHYNNRLQLVDIRVGDSSTDEWSWTRGALVYYYGTTARDGWNAFANSTDNNGNVLRQVNYAPLSGGGYEIPQLDDYTYDALNRNTSVTEAQQNSAGTWTFNLFTQNFGYDRWGNRTVSCSPCQSGVTGDNFTVDTATNRLTAKNGIGLTYDSAGNQTYDATGNRWFDGENKMYKAVQSGTTSYYVYDADGKRVRRIVGATETWMVYGISDELIAEYTTNGASGSPQKEYGYRGGQMLIVAQTSPLEIRWTVPDHLGTPRMNIMGNGASGGLLSSVKRHDYLPFGEELGAGVGLRSSSSHGYEPPSDGVRQKFGGKEKDIETGLDYFVERYYSNNQGRFILVDPLGTSAIISDPQTMNRYIFALNNPLKYVDSDGLEPKSAWDMLTKKEKKIIAPKIKPDKGKTVAQTFNSRFEVRDKNGRLDSKATASNVMEVRNFIDRAGGRKNSPMWQQIGELKGITGPHLVVDITNHQEFIKAAKAEGFQDIKVSDWLFSFTPWGYHRHSSIREITVASTDVSMHFANDNGDSTYYVHWDPTSVTFVIPAWANNNDTDPIAVVGSVNGFEWLYRGIAHGSFPSPSKVREQLKKFGYAPKDER